MIGVLNEMRQSDRTKTSAPQEEKDLAIRLHGRAGERRIVEAPITGLGACTWDCAIGSRYMKSQEKQCVN